MIQKLKILCFTLFFFHSTVLFAKKYGLLIGTNYKGNQEKISELNVSEKDVFFLRGILEKKAKFDKIDLLIGKNVTKKNILQALTQLSKITQKEDIVLIYFSGHGGIVRDRQDKNKLTNILVCYMKPHLTDTEFHSYIAKIKTPKTIIILDACYSGGINKKNKKTRGFQEIPIDENMKGVIIQNPEELFFKDKVILSSSDADETSVELGPPVAQGLFTYQFGHSFEDSDLDKNQMTSLLEIFFQAKKKTFSLAKKLNHKQNPQISGKAEDIFLMKTKDEPKKETVTPTKIETGNLLVKTTIIENVNYKKIPFTISRSKKYIKRKVKIFINGKEMNFKTKTVSSKNWGSYTRNGKIIQGKIFHFQLSKISAGIQNLTIESEGYSKIEKQIAILPNTENEIDIIRSLKDFGSIQGKVFYKTLDNPVQNQTIFMPTITGIGNLQKKKTDKEGRFWFTNLKPEKYEILVSFAESIPLENSEVRVQKGKVARLSVVLKVKLKSIKTKY